MKIIKGDLIKLAKEGVFDVIAHGCNCFCIQGAGLAKQMVEHFQTNNPEYYYLEYKSHKGNIDKLGRIEIVHNLDFNKTHCDVTNLKEVLDIHQTYGGLFVINAYTQFEPGVNNLYPGRPIVDYNAVRMCFTKINYLFKGMKVGLPWIGTGLAEGDKQVIKYCMKEFLTNVDLTVVEYEN